MPPFVGLDGLDACRWFCAVIQSANGSNVLSARFLCDTLERALPMAVALPVDNFITVFCQLESNESRHDVIDMKLRPVLADLNFEAGVSRTFLDVFHARNYFAQARCALETGIELEEDETCYYFDSVVLSFLLSNSCGDFSSQKIVSPELVRLARKSEEGVDYLETLRVYLENECSTTKTARLLYVHRSTLDDRINRIKKYVNLDTPEDRLYLRICLSLEDRTWVDNPDVR